MARKISLSSLGQQFRGLDPKDPSVWPAAPRRAMLATVFLAIVGAGYGVDWQAQMDELEAGQAQEMKLKEEYVSKYRQAINLDLYKEQLVEVNVLLGNMLRQLPNKSQMEALITDINNAGIGRGLQFDLFRPAPAETKQQVYAELPIAIRVTGAYHDMGRFAADVGRLPRIVTINDISIAPVTGAGHPPGSLVMEATAKTFRYLDEAELAEARRAAAAAKKKGPGK